MTAQPVLVVGASGLLGGEVARRLLAAGVRVRGLSRDPARLAGLEALGAEVATGDLRDPASLARACAGMRQVFSSANGFMGRGASSPTRVDVPGYRSLLAAARAAGVERIVHTSAHGVSADLPVDFFRVKAAIDEVVRGAGVPWVLLRPSAFLEIWAGMGLAEARAGRPLALFGDGRRKANYIAATDVAEFAARILARPEVLNEAIDLGGPSTITQRELADLIERALGRPVRRRAVPVPVLRAAAVVLRPFNEVAARMMAMGAWAAVTDRPVPAWREAAERFGVAPVSAEEFLSVPPAS
jgi:uncharacterized protein YbjT (DUF2867 family)